MKKTIIFLIICNIINEVNATNYTPILAQVISNEQISDIENIQIDVSLKFVDTVNWDFEEYFDLPQNWYAQSVSQFFGITFLPGDSVIYSFTVSYNLDSLPFFPEKVTAIFPPASASL